MNILNMPTTIKEYKSLDDYFSSDVLDGALIVTSSGIMKRTLSEYTTEVPMVFHDTYGKGEPTDIKIDQMIAAKNKHPHTKIIAIGGGTVMDCAKLMVLKNLTHAADAFTGTVALEKAVPLICIPTTCGTGSEVTAITVAELTELHTKKGLGHPALQPDEAILIPELLKTLPLKPFMHSAIDALIHATESYLSPKASKLTKVLSLEATLKILKGFQQMSFHGIDKRFDYLEDFLIASCYAGISFGNAGVGAVHALSYPLGGKYHVAHGEANYQFFTAVFKYYFDKKADGPIIELATAISKILDCRKDHVFETLESLIEKLIEKPSLRSYGMAEKDIILFTEEVIEGQQRLLANNYVALSKDDIKMIYSSLY